MKNYYILVLSFCSIFIFGQKKKSDFSKNPIAELNDYTSSEGKVNKDYKPSSLGLRIKNYPFNRASKIKIVSYNLNFPKQTSFEPIPIPRTKEDSLKVNELINRPKSIDFRVVLETQSENLVEQSKTLNLNEISKLTHILFNTCSKYHITERSQSGCFFPRNAIIFYDESEKIFEIMEICFQCGGIETSPSKFYGWREACNYVYPELENFFIEKGLKTQYVNK